MYGNRLITDDGQSCLVLPLNGATIANFVVIMAIKLFTHNLNIKVR